MVIKNGPILLALFFFPIKIIISNCSIASIKSNLLQGQYNFSYQVEDGYSGNQDGHSENRLGSATAGAYHVLLPDGRVQTVEYTVDSYAGYKATVHFEGGSQEFR